MAPVNYRNRIEAAAVAPSCVGLLHDNTPELTTADVRPFVWSILLYRGEIQSHQAVAAVSAVCPHADLYGQWSEYCDLYDDRTKVQFLVDEVLGEMVSSGLLLYDVEADSWKLSTEDRQLPDIIRAVAGINGSLPQTYIAERELQNDKRKTGKS